MAFETRYKKYKLATLILSLFFGSTFAAGLICLFGFTLNVNTNITYYALAQNNTDNQELIKPWVLDIDNITSRKASMDTQSGDTFNITLIDKYNLNNSIFKVNVNLSIGWNNATKINSASVENASKNLNTYNNQITFQDFLKTTVSSLNPKYKQLNDFMNERSKSIATQIQNLNTLKNQFNSYEQEYSLIEEILKKEDDRTKINDSRNNINEINNLVKLNLESFNNELAFNNKVNDVRVLFFASLSLFLFSGACLLASLILLCLQIKEKVRGEYEIQKEQFDLSLFR